MTEYAFRYKSAETGRWRKRKRIAENEASLRAQLEREGLSEIGDITEIPPLPATEKQLDYLRDIGGDVSRPLTSDEASDCIDNALRNRKPGSDADRRLAARLGVEVTDFASKHRIYDRISGLLAQGEEPERFARWFVWRVYRNCCDRSLAANITDPEDRRIGGVASALAKDDRWLRNARKVARENTTGLRWFGEINQNPGESDATIAYKGARGALIRAGLIPERRKATVFDDPAHRPVPVPVKKSSNLPVLVGLIVIAIALFLIFA